MLSRAEAGTSYRSSSDLSQDSGGGAMPRLERSSAMKFFASTLLGSAAALNGVTTTTDWSAARAALRQRDVGAVFVEGAAAPADVWHGAVEGAAVAAIDVSCDDCGCAVAAVSEAFAPLWDGPDADAAAARQIVDLAKCYDACLDEKSDNGRVRVRATVTYGRATAPCPKLHIDFVALRGLVSLEGPTTVVAPEVNLAGSQLLPAWMVARMRQDGSGDAATVQPDKETFLLVKGESWGFGHLSAAHRSPDPTDARRVLLAFDRLCDVE